MSKMAAPMMLGLLAACLSGNFMKLTQNVLNFGVQMPCRRIGFVIAANDVVDSDCTLITGNFEQNNKGLKVKQSHFLQGYSGDANAEEDQSSFRQYDPVHTDAVTSVSAVGAGLCLSGSKDQAMVLFDFNSGTVQSRWTGHEKEVTKVTFGSHIGTYFSASRDKLVCMWQLGQPQPVRTFAGHDMVVTALTLNEENTLLCSGSRDNYMKIWDIQSGQCVMKNQVSRNLVTHAKWGVGSHLIAQTGEDKEVRIWDSRNLQVAVSFPRKQYIQTCCDLSEDNNYCLTSSNGFGGSGCEATLWDVRNKQVICEYKGHVETAGACIFVPASLSGGRSLIATSSSDCTVRIWDKDSKDCLALFTLSGSGPLTSIAPYDDGSLCISSFNTGVHVLRLGVTSAGEVKLSQQAQF